MKKAKEIAIGEIGVIDGQRVMAKEYLIENSCDDCCFSRNAGYNHPCPMKKCNGASRQDKKHVYFVKVDKNEENASRTIR